MTPLEKAEQLEGKYYIFSINKQVMQLIKLTDEHYIMVDDSEIKEGDWVYHCNSISIFQYDLDEIADSNYKKITHSTSPLEDGTTIHGIEHKRWVHVKYIDLSEIKELIGEVDVEKKEIILTDSQKELLKMGSVFYKDSSVIYYLPYIIINENNKWYIQLEDNKEKKYTEEDLKEMFYMGEGLSSLNDTDDNKFQYALKHIKPKTEWEVEFIDSKLKLL